MDAIDATTGWAITDEALWATSDGGKSWARTNEDRKLRQRAWYYTRIFADPNDTNTVYVLNTGFYRSSDGGKKFKNIPVPHGDNHDLWIAPNDPKRMIEANDGSANVSYDGGASWSEQDNASAQFYHVTTTSDFPYHVCGAQQDNTTLCGPSREPGGIGIGLWQDVGGGESGYIQARPDKSNIVYAGSYSYLSRKDLRTGETREVTPWPDNPMGHSAEDLAYRFQWTFPILISPHDPRTVYVGSNVLFKSVNEGESWTVVSPDLTRHDPATLGASGGPITKDQTSVEYYATIFALSESPLVRGQIWAGSDDGMIHLTRNGGATWTDVSPKGYGDWLRISSIDASRYAAGTVYVAANRYQMDDMRPYLLKSTDYGKTWTLITTGLPSTEFTRVLREDPVRRGLLYAGTERGVWVSFDDGGHWQSLQRNLPIVPVHDLAVKDNDLVVATHGRAFWILDDVTPLRQMSSAVASAPAHLFTPAVAYRVSWSAGFDPGDAAAHPSGKNPPSGVYIYYSLAHANQDVALEIRDAKGALIRHLTSRLDSIGLVDSLHADSVKAAFRDSLHRVAAPGDTSWKTASPPTAEVSGEDAPRRPPRPQRVPNHQGLNVLVWDMRYPDASWFTNLIMWAGSVRGPLAPPGNYTVTLLVGDTKETKPFVLKKDPRSPATQADLDQQFALLIKIRDTLTAANDAVKTIRNVRWQINDRMSSAPDEFKKAAPAVLDTLGAIEAQIYQVKNRSGQDPLNYPIRLNNKIAALSGTVASADRRPTQPSYAVYRKLSAQLAKQLTALDAVLRTELPKLNAPLKAAGQPVIVPKPVEVEPAKPLVGDDEETEER